MVRTKRKKATKANKQEAGPAKGEGAVQMVELADGGITEECSKLMLLVAEKAVVGDRNCLEQLVSLAHKTPQPETADVKASGLSQATVWEAEPEWRGESSEEGAETSIASREPENHLT
jgi:hypothetical protein